MLLVMICASASMARELTDDEVAKMIADAPGVETYPQAGAIILYHNIAINYAEDYSATGDEHLVVKILQDRGRDAFADIKRRYDKDHDSILVMKAVTHLEDGTIKEAEAKAIHDLNPASLANASIYSNIMQKVVSLPAVTRGATIEIKLRKYSEAPEEGEQVFIWGNQLFQGDEPVFYRELSVNVPSEMPIKHTFQNEGVTFNTTEEGGFTRYAWVKEHAPQIIPEPGMPEYIKVAPRLIYTNAESWEQIGSWFSEEFYAHVRTEGAIKEKAAELTKSSESRADKIRDISLFVIEDIRDIGEGSLRLGVAGYEPHDADVVLENKYGDWRDKTVLLVSMLGAVGVDAFPAFVHSSAPPLAEDHPSLRQFDCLYVYIPDYDGSPLWINPFADHCYFGFFPFGQRFRSLVVAKDTSMVLDTPNTPPEDNLASTRMDIQLSANGDAEGTVACMVTGHFDWQTRIRMKDATPKRVEQYFQGWANNLGEGSLSGDYKVSDCADLLEPVEVVQSFTTPELAVLEGEMMVLHTPPVPYGFATASFPVSEVMRFYNLEVGSNLTMRTEGQISLPEGYEAVYVPEAFSATNALGKWHTSYEINDNKDQIKFVTEVIVMDPMVDVDEYFDFKESFDSFNKPRNSLILLERVD